ncbi:MULTISPECIES: FAD:protein FMN transferase [Deinococcus]|uniref:FAD:protein FMN transferase n=1 Tax=Deinococcus rufus TaxID=2136097 RepID=A0ABV7Z798_9DEIO|nr:FAD:protein FMN transferase [Deinococcus sp. AB2017081]WQE97216.1 FAD:protein FMN transferase [Deinococcus sp. AB2017081]
MSLSFEIRAMDTEVRAEGRGARAALTEVRRLEALLSRFGHTPLTELNRWGVLENPPPELVQALGYALTVARRSGGLLTPAIRGALVAAGYDGHPGTPRHAAVRVPPLDGVVLSAERVTLPPGLTLDLGGTAKGWIVTRAARLLDGAGLLDAGGDLIVRQQEPCAVEVEHPFGGQAALLELPAGTWGVATSSTLKRAWPGGHHLIDPRTGRPLESGLVQVTAVSPSLLDAEVLCKMALFGDPALRRFLAGAPPPTLLAYDRQGQQWQWQAAGWAA